MSKFSIESIRWVVSLGTCIEVKTGDRPEPSFVLVDSEEKERQPVDIVHRRQYCLDASANTKSVEAVSRYAWCMLEERAGTQPEVVLIPGAWCGASPRFGVFNCAL